MEVVLANPRGFCAGVRMAIQTVERALEQSFQPVYVYHEIVHNVHVVRGLRDQGAIFVDDIEEIPFGQTVVFSAHGVSPAVRRKAEERGLRIIDATCPLVGKVHSEVRRFARQGYLVFLIGHANHDEVVGTVGEAPQAIQIIESLSDVDSISVASDAKVAYVTQTTLSLRETQAIIERLKHRFPRLVGPKVQDICFATQNRQDAVLREAPDADVVLVVGSINSSNSSRLCEVAASVGTPAYLVDDASAVECSWFQGHERVLVTAGASAPEDAVKSVVNLLVERFSATVSDAAGEVETVKFALPAEIACG